MGTVLRYLGILNIVYIGTSRKGIPIYYFILLLLSRHVFSLVSPYVLSCCLRMTLISSNVRILLLLSSFASVKFAMCDRVPNLSAPFRRPPIPFIAANKTATTKYYRANQVQLCNYILILLGCAAKYGTSKRRGPRELDSESKFQKRLQLQVVNIFLHTRSLFFRLDPKNTGNVLYCLRRDDTAELFNFKRSKTENACT